MLKIGVMQTLTVVSAAEFGVYLSETAQGREKVLLPKKYVPAGVSKGENITVFLYRDSEDRMVATTKKPYVTLGEFAVLLVAQQTTIGAFLDWGLDKDLLLPFREQTRDLAVGDRALVRLYEDKSGRLCASMRKVYPLLRTDSPYSPGDEVEGFIYDSSERFGLFVAVDDCYSALIPRREVHGGLRPGDQFHGRVTKVHADGKLDLSPNQQKQFQMDVDAQKIMSVLKEYEGVLPFTDKASPEVIEQHFGMSKAAFKRAVGRLYRQRRIEITRQEIRLAADK